MIQNEDLRALKNYVTAQDAVQYDHLSPGTILIDLTHSNLKQRHIEIRFDLHDSIGFLRDRIHQKTGTPPSFQHLQIKIRGDPTTILSEIPPNTDNDMKLGYYSLVSGVHVVHCVDVDPHSGSRGGRYEDVSLVEKYRMTEEEYNKRRGTLRDWERKQKAKDPTFSLAKHAKQHREMVEAQRQAKLGLPLPKGFEWDERNKRVVRIEEEEEVVKKHEEDTEFPKESVEGIEVGMRCEAKPGSRRGEVAFVGEILELGGFWVGVRFDEPVAKSDGKVKGKEYFEANPGYGGFLRGKNVQVGD
eukprot:CAMPEP_0118714590 /NCGR_PEP_ID=MMETSP0800-20121206/26290_1 /TAXON_ID=210618 ORGANISM="Striatella unipunctata, Strain CCMP2910" /NCGR_SAMPLE_ID=MMETSP0800 /ASSEMBLY_ACC=CAM_ASM_000638 /LENGTH=300 /DNA_ID=CAMNT_0006620437 /DNA_START=31 /DNA_END=933 /DNA_ORIENTATION=+